MLQTIRDKVSGWIAGVFLGAIAIVFVFWGIDFQSTTSTYAAKVNGEKISLESVRRAWQQRQSQLQQMLRDELPPEMVKSQQSMLLDQFVRQNLLQQRAQDLGYRVSDASLAQRVKEIPQFQVEGKFSADRYNALIKQSGTSIQQFEADLQSELLVTQVQNAIVDSAFTLPYELERRYALQKQQRELDYVLIPAASFADQVKVTDEQLQAHYDANKSQFLTQETVDLEYVELTRARAESAVTVSEEALREYYAQVKERFESPERRRARHVLITAEDGVDDAAAQKKAEEVASQAKSGADFAQLAQKNSKDPGSAQQGGDLGWAQRGMFVGPFEDALFGMTVGEIRGPVKTQFGYHVIKLEEIDAARIRSFEDARADLEVEYRKERAQTLFAEQTQKLEELAFASLTELDSVAKTMDLQVRRIAGFTREGGGELGAERGVIDAAFSEDVVERGQNSPIVAIGEDRALVLRVAGHKPPQERPLAEVRSQIESQLRTQAMRDAAQKQGSELIERLKNGEAWTAVTAAAKLTPAGRRFVDRQDGVAPPAVLRAAFAASASDVGEAKPHVAGATTDDGNYAVYVISQVRAGDPKVEPEAERTARRSQTARQLGNEEFSAYLAEAERTAEVEKNPAAFE